MLKVKLSMNCEYELSRADEIAVLTYVNERGITLEDAIKELHKYKWINILEGYYVNGTITEIGETTFEKEDNED